MGKSVTVAPQDEVKERPLDNVDSTTVVYRLGGAFFGAAATVGSVLDRIADQYHHFVLDCSGLHCWIAATGVIAGTVRKARRAGVSASTSPAPNRMYAGCWKPTRSTAPMWSTWPRSAKHAPGLPKCLPGSA